MMEQPQPTDNEETRRLIEIAALGDAAAWEMLISRYRERLKRLIVFRIDPRLRSRIDPSDVIQDVMLDVVKKLPAYLKTSALPFYLWLRFKTGNRLKRLHRDQLQAQRRDPSREIRVFHGPFPEASSIALANYLVDSDTSPDNVAIKKEQIALLCDALDQLDPLDKEVLVLRHFECLTSVEAGQVLGVTMAAAAKRYFRAVLKLRELLIKYPDFLDGFIQ